MFLLTPREWVVALLLDLVIVLATWGVIKVARRLLGW
jgi:hypothetical protein